MPERILAKVLFPAPFSPTTERISPLAIEIETSSSTVLLPNDFEIAVASSRAVMVELASRAALSRTAQR